MLAVLLLQVLIIIFICWKNSISYYASNIVGKMDIFWYLPYPLRLKLYENWLLCVAFNRVLQNNNKDMLIHLKEDRKQQDGQAYIFV